MVWRASSFRISVDPEHDILQAWLWCFPNLSFLKILHILTIEGEKVNLTHSNINILKSKDV